MYGVDDITPELVADTVKDSWHLVVDKLPKKNNDGCVRAFKGPECPYLCPFPLVPFSFCT